MNLRSILSAAGVLGAAFGAQALRSPACRRRAKWRACARSSSSLTSRRQLWRPQGRGTARPELQRRPGQQGHRALDQRPQWVFDFDNDLPPGVRCTVSRAPAFKSARRATHRPRSYQFNTGGPFVQTSARARAASTRSSSSCCAQRPGHAGERAGQRVVRGRRHRRAHAGAPGRRRRARRAAQGSQRLDEGSRQDPLRFVALACNRRLTPSARCSWCWARRGHARRRAPTAWKSALTSRCASLFGASFSCERENAPGGLPADPPDALSFNAPVPRKLAAAIRLKSAPATSLKPTLRQRRAPTPTTWSTA